MNVNITPNWKLIDNLKIEREFVFKNFTSALKFVNKVGKLAEKEKHHPDILIHNYNKVKLTLSTHSAGKVTDKDFELAEKINEIFK